MKNMKNRTSCLPVRRPMARSARQLRASQTLFPALLLLALVPAWAGVTQERGERALLPAASHAASLAAPPADTGMPGQPAAPAPVGKSQHLASRDEVPQGLAKSDWQSIRAAHTAWEHGFMPVEGGWQARNPGQQWTTRFDGRGLATALPTAAC